jgi:hypothetical protein
MNKGGRTAQDLPFVILDLDRTLLNTDVFLDMLGEELVKQSVPASSIEADRAELRSMTGTSVSGLEYFQARYGKTTLDKATTGLLSTGATSSRGAGLVYEGVADLLRLLDARSAAVAIVTYGKLADQALKLDLLRMVLGMSEAELPALITQLPRKAEWMFDRWYDPVSGQFRIPDSLSLRSSRVTELLILDDKLENLTSVSPHIRGILVQHVGKGGTTIEDVAQRLSETNDLLDLSQHYAID